MYTRKSIILLNINLFKKLKSRTPAELMRVAIIVRMVTDIC